MSSGLFIVLEGIDRSGKTTISNSIFSHLISKGVPSDLIFQLSFPNRTTPTGKLLDSYLKNETELKPEVSHLLFSANRWEMSDLIRKLKNEGKIIICDRYFYSGIVYSMARGVKYDWAKKSDQGIPVPDYCFFIDVKPEVVSLRKNFGDERFEEVNVLEKIYQFYLEVLKDEKNAIFVDGNKSLTEIVEEICGKLGFS